MRWPRRKARDYHWKEVLVNKRPKVYKLVKVYHKK